MGVITKILLIFSLICPFGQPFSPLTSSLVNNNSKSIDIEPIVNVDKSSTPKYTASASGDAKANMSNKNNSVTELDFTGYCTISVKDSNFKVLQTDTSDDAHKTLEYNDNKSTLYIGYVTDIDEDTDIKGFITFNQAKLNTTATNNTVEEKHGQEGKEITWTKIKADAKTNGFDQYLWYTTNTNEDTNLTSAFWIKAVVSPDVDSDRFIDDVTEILDTFNLYGGKGTLFKTPNTGYYKNYKNTTKANTKGYEAQNDQNNQVFKSRGGYVVGAKISSDWKDLEIILDGHKYTLSSGKTKLTTFEGNGFKINDPNINYDEDRKVYPGNVNEVQMRNSNGTVINVAFYNDNQTKEKDINTCTVVGITVDSSKLDAVNTTKSDEFYNSRTKKDAMAAQNAKDKSNHELILPNGITWGVYADDLKASYGSCMSNPYDDNSLEMTWTAESGAKKLDIRTGNVSGIQYVRLSTMDY